MYSHVWFSVRLSGGLSCLLHLKVTDEATEFCIPSFCSSEAPTSPSPNSHLQAVAFHPHPASPRSLRKDRHSITMEIVGIVLEPMKWQQHQERDSCWSNGSLRVRNRYIHMLKGTLYSEPTREINTAGSMPRNIKGNCSLSLPYLVLDSFFFFLFKEY